MSYRVKTETFEGPFDLLLHLVSRQKVDIGAISITEIADQYLAEVERMKEFDLDVASDFLVVAATLLNIKAASLIPSKQENLDIDDDFEDLTPEQTRDILVARLATYKQFKNASVSLGGRYEAESLMHTRHASLEPEFLGLMPDYLQGMTLHGLAVICAQLAMRRDTFLLEAEHIAAVPISIEKHLEGIYSIIKNKRNRSFNELIGKNPSPQIVVVTFLAVLELYKRGVITVKQDEAFGDMDLHMEDNAPEITNFSVPDWGAPEEDIPEENEFEEGSSGEGVLEDGSLEGDTPAEGSLEEGSLEEGALEKDTPEGDIPEEDTLEENEGE